MVNLALYGVSKKINNNISNDTVLMNYFYTQQRTNVIMSFNMTMPTKILVTMLMLLMTGNFLKYVFWINLYIKILALNQDMDVLKLNLLNLTCFLFISLYSPQYHSHSYSPPFSLPLFLSPSRSSFLSSRMKHLRKLQNLLQLLHQ